ncbi:hypothetical protein [Arthrobacter sp. R-11]|uniref:hypothetical protein n=1 Tax=Arthrobacter sp. R-11 TaxID=3404053 RepID=UPI003CE7B976
MSDRPYWVAPRNENPEHPLTVPESEVALGTKTVAPKSIPVWVRLRFEDGSEETVKGFAMAWTRVHVFVQIPWAQHYYTGTNEVWVKAEDVRRRKLQGLR